MARKRRTSKTIQFKIEGFDEYKKYLEEFGLLSTGMGKRALYEGVAVTGAAIRQAIQDLPYHPTKGISHAQKEGLLEGLGYTHMKRKKGAWFVKIGFDGYNNVHTEKYPNGQPNAMIAAAINTGTSRRKRTNFITKAVNKAKKGSIDAMKAFMDHEIEVFEKGNK